jgi:hypothetical protein
MHRAVWNVLRLYFSQFLNLIVNPCILITSGPDGVFAVGKRGGGNYVLVKLGMQDKLDMGLSTVVV